MLVTALGFAAALTSPSLGFAAVQAEYFVQVAAEKESLIAQGAAQEWQARSPETSVTVVSVAADPKGFPFKVLMGPFASRSMAEQKKAALKVGGFESLIRTSAELSPEHIWAAIAGGTTETKKIFSDPPQGQTRAVESVTDRPSHQTSRRQEVKAMRPTTSPETLAAIEDLARALPDTDPLKGEMIILCHWRRLGLVKAYQNSGTDVGANREALMAVANGRIASDAANLVVARAVVARVLHYHDRDKPAALAAYRQILADALAGGDFTTAAKMRMELAGCMIELARETGFNITMLEPHIVKLWRENSALESYYDTTASEQASVIRCATARLVLMLTELHLERQQWNAASAMNQEMITNYAAYPECQGELAEAYCHQAHIGLRTGNRAMCLDAVAQAIATAERHGRAIWGDVNRDPLFKAHTWKNAALKEFNAPTAERDELKAEMQRRFPGHPGLTTLFEN